MTGIVFEYEITVTGRIELSEEDIGYVESGDYPSYYAVARANFENEHPSLDADKISLVRIS